MNLRIHLRRLVLTLAAAVLISACGTVPAQEEQAATTAAAENTAAGAATAGTGAAEAGTAETTSTEEASSTAGAVAAAEAADWPVTITDDEGRTVTIPAQPQRILSLAPSNTETLFALELGERVVGVDNFSDYPMAAQDLPKVGDLYNPNYEAMVALDPDLALAIGGSQKVWGKLEELGVPVVVIQPENLEEIIGSIRLVGQITGAREQAEAVAQEMEERLAAVRKRAEAAGSRPRVFWEVWHEPLMSAGPGSFYHDLIGLAGGENLAGDADSPWPEVSAETIVAADPEVILTISEEWAEQLRAGELPAWSETTAVREGRIHILEDNLVSRPGPRMIEGLEQVAEAILGPADRP